MTFSADVPPCPRCSAPYAPGSAERYWEARWRDEKAENERLRKALGVFLGGNDRFQVAVGGNPLAIDEMLTEARSLLDGNKPGTFDPRDAGFTLEDCEWPQEAIDQIMIDPKEDPLKDDVE